MKNDILDAATARQIAERIINRVVGNVLEIAHTRFNLGDLEDSDPINMEDFVADGLQVALGEDTGCLDPDELSPANNELLYVEKEILSIGNSYEPPLATCERLVKASQAVLDFIPILTKANDQMDAKEADIKLGQLQAALAEVKKALP